MRHLINWLLALTLLMLFTAQATADEDDEGAWQDANEVGSGEPAAPESAQPTPDTGPSDSKQYKCVISGLPWNESSTRVLAIFKVDGQRQRGRFLNLAYMMIQYKLLQEEGHDVSIESTSVLDYASFGSGGERMILVNDDWSNVIFISTDTALPGSKSPYYAAFSTAEDTKAALEKLPGKVLSYEAVMKRLLSALRSEEQGEGPVESEEDSMRRHFKFGEPEV